ncbi:extracellular solute-binding protein [Paenibacillus lentus]|uniref:Extracellular solute-binding protein n=1 Tax=Paenibacillus lentus TaxID=1338368 RepID=A0A3S8RQA0_9BACL|nr:extracellular solute-binding protein [Paenibacillus lentus]AZK45027.1 extracellular solute-binding protein [Paenibacillus lentus]
MNFKQLWIVLLLPLLLFGCSAVKTEETAITLDFWTTTSEKETEVLTRLIESFEQEHPDIDVNLKSVEFGEASNNFKIATLTQDAPDILRSDIGWTTEFVDLDILLPLDDMVTAADQEDYFSTAIQNNIHEGHIYGLPMVTDAPALLYNKELLSKAGYTEPPQTLDELMEIAKAITNEDHYGIYISPDSYYSLPYVWGFGGEMINEEMNIEIANESSVQGIEFMVELIKAKVTQPDGSFEDWNARMMEDFKNGKVAMIINGPWATADILSGEAFKNSANLGVAAIPGGPGGEGSPIGGHNLVISKYTKYPKEAYQLIHYLNSIENQVTMAKEAGTLPTRVSAYDDKDLMSNTIFQGFKAQLEVARSRPLIPESSLLLAEFSTYLEQILKQGITPQEGLTQVASVWAYLIK